MDPKSGPGGLQRVQNKHQKRCLISAYFFNAFLIDFGSQNGTPKGSQNLSKIRLGRPKAPQGRQRPPRSLQGAILRPPGSHFGAILGTIFGPFLAGWDHFRPNFGTISDTRQPSRCHGFGHPLAACRFALCLVPPFASQVFWVGGCPR